MKAELGVGLHNKFDIQLVNADGDITQSITAYNTVLNNYYTNLSNNSGIYFGRLNLGTGTGTPSVTDTSLFSHLTDKNFEFSKSNVRYLDSNQYSVAASIIFTETEAIGQISELGVSNPNAGTLYTHAMVTDAEGHVISINKTNTDRLIITVTMYLTLTRPSNVVPYKNVATLCYSVYGETTTTGTGYIEQIVAACLGFNTNILPNGSDVVYSLSPGCPGSSVTPSYVGYTPLAMTCDTSYTNNVIRMQNRGTILSTDYNLAGTYQIYGMSTPIGYIPITSDIFTPLSLTLSKTADGTQKAFNFGVAELMSEVRVYINDVLQPTNSYTWNGKDYSIFQAWETCRANYVIKSPTCSATSNWYTCYTTPIFNYMPLYGSSPTWHNQDIVYDFGIAISFNRAYKPSPTAAYSNWQYSNDKTTWTTVEIPASPNSNYYDFPNPILAKYLRMQNAISDAQWTDFWKPVHPVLCCYSDQLVFNTAPAEGSIVKIEAKSAYPIKNSHWIMDQFVLDLKVSKA